MPVGPLLRGNMSTNSQVMRVQGGQWVGRRIRTPVHSPNLHHVIMNSSVALPEGQRTLGGGRGVG